MTPLLALLTVLGTPALAEDVEDTPPEAPPTRRQWDSTPYIQPVAGGSIYSSGGETYTSLVLGAQGGLRYVELKPDDPRLFGHARVRGQYLIGGSDVRGLEMRAGNFVGPWYKIAGLQTGPDLFWSEYTYGPISLDGSLGLAWPVIGLVELEVLNLYAGVQPAWLFNPDRPHADWKDIDAFGFGHEFSYLAGASISSPGVKLSVQWTRTITAFGDQTGIGVGMRLGR